MLCSQCQSSLAGRRHELAEGSLNPHELDAIWVQKPQELAAKWAREPHELGSGTLK